VLGLGLNPDNSAASEALDNGPEDRRMRISVAVLDEDMIDGLDIRGAENIMVLQEKSDPEIGAECPLVKINVHPMRP
jgi:hypothetical protein